MTSARTSYEFPCELSEKQIEADFATFLGFCSSFLGEYRLLDIDERVTGADKMLQYNATAFYLQFKKPTALRPLYGPQTRAKREDKRQSIRRFRQQNGLDQTPHSICFQLRKPAKHAKDLQHNVLLSLENPPTSRAIYVCPLTYTSAAYVAALRDDRLPWFYDEPRARWLVEEPRYVARLASTSTFLRAHAAITPHARVNDWNHYYSFSAHGTDIAFHSPTVVSEGPSRLSDYILSQIRQTRAHQDWPTVEQLAASRRQIAEELQLEMTQDESAIIQIQTFGKKLRERYGIRQVAVLRTTAR